MIRPEGYPEACPWSDAEMEEWKRLFAGIFRMAHERGIDTYLVPFNIFVPPEFSKAHNVAMNNLEHHHFVDGDTSEIVKRYTRDCVRQVLEEYPELSGMGLTLGEGMGGMTPLERERWMKETIIEGMRLAGRSSKLIHRIPFSGNTGSLGETTVEMERITREGIEEEARMDFIEGPVWASLKFNWSHPLSTEKLIKVHGGKLYGTYFDPEPKGYKVTWKARNEDIFCLRWGVADFIRSHIRGNTPPYVGGYSIGSETYIPAKDYFTRPEWKVPWKYAFERQWLYYKLWGRLLYDPETPDEIFAAEFVRRYGEAARTLFAAHSLAGRTPLRLGFSFDATWDFSLYEEGFMALDPASRRVSFISVDRLISQPPMDPRYISIPEYVRAAGAGRGVEAGRISPPAMADELERDCRRALELVRGLDAAGDTALMFEIADIKAWANLGLYFACKLRGALSLQLFRTGKNEADKRAAAELLREALRYWDEVVAITRPLYADMPLEHLSEQDGKPWKENDHLRFHWELLRPEVARDIEIAENG
jgi:hypothetical protein